MGDFDGEADYQRFKDAVPASAKAVHKLAQHLQAQGLTVQIPPMRVCKSYADRNNGYGDSYDLSVLTHYEVKHHDFHFSCAADYPYENVIVDRADKIKALKEINLRVAAYCQFNQLLTCFLMITDRSREDWFLKKVHDRVKGYDFEVYMCPKERAIFRWVG